MRNLLLCFVFWFQGEKLLGSLGGIFSRTWKPKKTRSITGPVITRGMPLLKKWISFALLLHLTPPFFLFFWEGESPKRRVNNLETREKLGLNQLPKPDSRTNEPLPESADAYQKIEVWICDLKCSVFVCQYI